MLTTGPGTLVVYRSSARGATARVTSRRLHGIGTQHLVLPLSSFVDGGWYWFDLVAGSEPLVLDAAAGALLAASPWLFGFAHQVRGPHLAFGLFSVVASLITRTRPARA